jgi:hypothetical protein
MAASDAGEHLAQFAAGTAEDVCTPEGRALLRGAVRAYGAELAHAGVIWPILNEAEPVRSTEMAVAVAFASGLLDLSDFRGDARNAVNRFAHAQWPQLANMRAAGRVACKKVLDLQQAAMRLVAEMDRYARMAAAAQADPGRLRRQRERLQQTQAQFEALAAAIEAEVAAARRGS